MLRIITGCQFQNVVINVLHIPERWPLISNKVEALPTLRNFLQVRLSLQPYNTPCHGTAAGDG